MYFILDRNESWNVIEIVSFVAERELGVVIMGHYPQKDNGARSCCTLRAAGSLFSPSITGQNNVLEQENEWNIIRKIFFSDSFTEKWLFLQKSGAFLWGRDTGLIIPCSWRFWIVRSLQNVRCLFQFQLWLRENKFLIACKRKQTENSSDVFHVPYFFF